MKKERATERKLWIGYYPRFTPKKVERLEKLYRKEKQKGYQE